MARQTAPVDGTSTSGAATAAVVLAAGAGTRFAGPTHKLDADIGGRSILRHALDAALASAIGPVIVVLGDELSTALPADVLPVVNAGWRSGQMSSLHIAIESARRLGVESIVVGLGDQPFVSPGAWRSVSASNAPVAVATYGGQRGHPVRLHRSVWSLLPPGGDEGARTLMRLRPDLVREIPCQGSPTDVDTLEDLHRWQNNS
jgi:CTP:molybdopterin cytidylyltransferase MocA